MSYINNNAIDNTFANGWYAILPAKELSKNSQPLAIERFGLSLVLWRNNNGKVSIFLNRCPHRGAKLSLGKIINNSIRCPFHGFNFNDNGICVMAPEFDRDIPGLKTTTFASHETLEMIWMYWGRECQPHNYTALEKIHLSFSAQYSGIQKTWNSHITYCIENQLDYTHLKFVHHNTIGRGFKMPKDPLEVYDENSITIFLKDKHNPAIQYFFPNAWVLNISAHMKLMLFFSPINQENTRLYLRVYRDFFQLPILKNITNVILNISNYIILKQDEQIVASQGKLPSYYANEDLLMRYDKAISHFRKVWSNNIEPR